MDELKVGDVVMTMSDSGLTEASEVIAWLHHDVTIATKYLEIEMEDDHSLTVSPDHLIYSQRNMDDEAKFVFAGEVQIGDNLFVNNDGQSQPANITNISSVLRKGAFAPLTSSGTLLVDGVFASCYASTNWDLATVHKAFLPLQIAYDFGIDFGQSEAGISNYANFLLSIQNALTISQNIFY